MKETGSQKNLKRFSQQGKGQKRSQKTLGRKRKRENFIRALMGIF